MNKKKIFGYLFLGLLTVGATGTVTSCKDYDDDINTNKTAISDLQKQLATLQSALDQAKADATTAHANFATKGDIKDLQTEMAKLATADALQKAIDNLTELINGKVDQSAYDAKVKEIEEAIDGIDSNLNTLGTSLTNLETAQKAADANIKLQQTALENLQKALTDGLATKADQSTVTALQDSIKNLQDEIKALSGTNATTLDELKKQMEELNKKVDAFGTQINVLTVFVKHALASLTFIPEYFTEGIEAALVPAYQGAYNTTEDNKAFTKVGKDADLLSGYGIANYNVSPTSVDLVGSKADFYSLGSTILTRSGANLISPVNTELTDSVVKANYKDGVLTVPFKADFAAISKLSADKLPIAALQISRGDTTVTSDYATVIAKTFTGMVVADNGANNAVVTAADCGLGVAGTKHLFTVWSDMTAANANITHDVAYNSHLNLDSIAEVHVTTDGKERTLSAAELKALGLKIVFKPVEYTQGGNNTSESAHIELESENGQTVAYPRNVTADGKTIENTVANNASVGREPIVVAKVVDETTGKKVYAWGYIKIKITTPKQDASKFTTEPMTFTGDVYANCDDASLTTSWSQIEALVYSKLNISKETFENTYELDDNTTDAKQFALNNGAYAEASSKIGKVAEKQDEKDPTTNILTWTLSKEDLKALKDKVGVGADGVSTKDVTIYVHFKLKNDSKTDNGVYVPLTIKAGQLHYAVATLDGSKVLSQWYKLNSTTNATSTSGDDEVRVNVPVPTTADNVLATDEFKRDLHKYFLNSTLSYKLNDETHFSALKAGAGNNKLVFKFINPSTTTGNATFNVESDGTWTVTGVSGTKYALKVANDYEIDIVKKGDAAVSEPIVKLTDAGVISFVESADADDILNYKGHDALGERETFTAYIGMAISNTCYDVPLSGKTWFNVRFVRPLDLTQPEAKSVKDAPNEWQDIDIASLVKVNDWRNYVGDPTNSNGGKDDGKNIFDFNYYDIQLGTDADAIYTDANLGSDQRNILTSTEAIKKLVKTSSISGLELKLKDQSTSVLQYKNSSAVTGTFHLYVPVKMTYVFGKTPQTLYSVVTVTESEGQQTAKKR